jgi:hypothetical protein
VVGIATDRELRHRFEDKLVTHLRGHYASARTSYPLVEDLTQPADRDRLLVTLEAEGVDGVITVRPVPLADADAVAAWPQAWSAWMDAHATLRELVDTSLPGPAKAPKYLGAEITLWEIATGRRLWAARTGAYKPKELRAAAGDLMQQTIARLREVELVYVDESKSR